MTDIPILMSAPMVRACLREVDEPGTGKTNTRRMLRKLTKRGLTLTLWQNVKPGDRLWVKENYYRTDNGDHETAVYAADEARVAQHINQIGQIAAAHGLGIDWQKPHIKLRPSIHMPRWASRLTLIVTATKVEPIQAICEADAIAEGCKGRLGPNPDFPDEWDPTPQEEFRDLWISLHGPNSWDANPEVVALTFTPHKLNIDAMPLAAAA